MSRFSRIMKDAKIKTARFKRPVPKFAVKDAKIKDIFFRTHRSDVPEVPIFINGKIV